MKPKSPSLSKSSRVAEIEYVAIGLTIGMVAALLLISGMIIASPSTVLAVVNIPGSEDTATPGPPSTTPTISPTTAPTFIQILIREPPVTNTPFDPSPTATVDPVEQMVNTGQLVFSGPLKVDQQIRLYQASLYYIAPDPEASIHMAKEINGVQYGNPSNTCGPLAIAILRDAGLLGRDIVPHEFWLLNPFIPNDRQVLNRTFPANQFEHTITLTPINKMDWISAPLQPGDFLYIKHGSWGNFDHMLVVNRVDNSLRAYAVTNYNTPGGFIIDEVMLYDPHDRSVGLFHEWTKQEFATQGSTGFGGFELWRLRAY
jgi:hypothetical protein